MTSTSTQSGFTLIELLVVLMIMGLVTGVAMPRLSQLYSSLEGKSSLESIIRQIDGLGFKALTTKQSLVLGQAEAGSVSSVELELPDGWQVQSRNPVTYSSNGVCTGGTVMIYQGKDIRQQATLVPPFCQWPKGEL